jgi:hypothetical protein
LRIVRQPWSAGQRPGRGLGRCCSHQQTLLLL